MEGVEVVILGRLSVHHSRIATSKQSILHSLLSNLPIHSTMPLLPLSTTLSVKLAAVPLTIALTTSMLPFNVPWNAAVDPVAFVIESNNEEG